MLEQEGLEISKRVAAALPHGFVQMTERSHKSVLEKFLQLRPIFFSMRGWKSRNPRISSAIGSL